MWHVASVLVVTSKYVLVIKKFLHLRLKPYYSIISLNNFKPNPLRYTLLCLFSSIFFRSHHIQSIFDIVNSNFFPHPTLVDTLGIYHKNNDGDNCFEQAKDNLKLVSAIFYQILISHQMIALQKLLKMFFISSKKFFLFSRYSDVCISSSPLLPLSAITLEVDRR